MIKIKWGVVCGAVAFALAFLTSLLLGHTSFVIALLRALIFAAVFFGLGIGIRALIANFIPDLLFSGGNEDAAGNVFSGAGSRVNITVGDAPEPALPQQNRTGTEAVEVGTFNDLLSGSIKAAASESAHAERDIDQTPETSYTEDQAEESALDFGRVKLDDIGDFSMDFGAFVPDDSGGDGAGDAGMDSFSLFPGVGDSDSAPDTPEPERKPSGNKPMQLEGDFDPKEIAAGIRTVLKKEKG